MALQPDIDAVLGTLGPTAATEGWTALKVSTLLDSGMTKDAVSLAYWESRMAATSNLVNMSESGSSRNLSDIYKNAAAQAEYFRVKKAAGDPLSGVSRRVKTRSIKRV